MILIHPTQFLCPVRIRQIESTTGLVAVVRAGRVVLVPQARSLAPVTRRAHDESATPAA